MTDAPTTSRTRWYDLFIAFFGGNLLGAVFGVIAGAIALVIAMQHGFHPTADNLKTYLTRDFWANHVALVITDIGFVIVIWLMARWRYAHPIGHFFPPLP